MSNLYLTMNDWQWKKKDALAEQLKFFGAKKQKFISVYAKKPRILVKVKGRSPVAYDKSPDAIEAAYQHQHLLALCQQQMNRGIQHGSIGCSQMAAAQQGMGMYGGQGGSGLHHMSLSGMLGGGFI